MAEHTAWTPELEAALAEPFPAEHVQTKTIQNRSISYVAWHRYAAKLNRLVGGGWSMGEPTIREVNGKLVMGVPVTILGTTRINFGDEDEDEYEIVVDDQTGESKEKRTMYGSPCTNAFAQAFKRTCALFGVGLDMYDKGARAKAVEADNTAACPKCGSPLWDNRADKPTPKSPDFKCKSKTCQTAGRPTAFWWDTVTDHVRTLATTAVGAGQMTAEKQAELIALIEKGEAPRVFAAWKLIEVKLAAARMNGDATLGTAAARERQPA